MDLDESILLHVPFVYRDPLKNEPRLVCFHKGRPVKCWRQNNEWVLSSGISSTEEYLSLVNLKIPKDQLDLDLFPLKAVDTKFRAALEDLININSKENGSDTPDFILAEYLSDCLEAFDKAVSRRTQWYGDEPESVPPPANSPW